MIHELHFVIRNRGTLQCVYSVILTETTLGRSSDNTLCLPEDYVSRRHAVIVRTATGFVIRDLGSRNGIRVNGQFCGEAEVSQMSVVEIGSYSLKAFGDFASADASAVDFGISTVKKPCPDTSFFEETKELERRLTPAQRRMYIEFLKGRSDKETAIVWGISIHTVHTHARAIYELFGVSSRAELLARSVVKPFR